MSVTLQRPELMLDFLIPAGREKLRLEEVAQIIGTDDGKPVSVRSIINGLESGALFGSRFHFTKSGDRERHRVQHMLRSDVQLALLEARTAPEPERLQRFLDVLPTFSREALIVLATEINALRIRLPISR